MAGTCRRFGAGDQADRCHRRGRGPAWAALRTGRTMPNYRDAGPAATKRGEGDTLINAERGKPESVLIFLQGTEASAHPGIIDGYEQLIAGGEVAQLDVMPVLGPTGTERGGTFWQEALERALGHGTTLVVFQYYHSRHLPDPREAIRKLKALPSGPMVVTTLGDPFMNGYLGQPEVPRSFLQAAEASDLVTLTSMGVMADHVARHTSAPILLLPNGACQVRFGSLPERDGFSEPDFDVVFVGSRNSSRNPFRPYHHYGRKREELALALEKRFGNRFGLFGKGWEGRPSNQGPVPFADQASTAGRARVVVGGVPFSRARYYSSNRPFIQITSGTPMVDTAVPGVDRILKSGHHWILVDHERLVKSVELTLELGDGPRAELGRQAANFVLQHHTQAQRVATLVENVRRLRAARATGVRTEPHLPFFLPDTDMSVEAQLASRNWPRTTVRADERNF